MFLTQAFRARSERDSTGIVSLPGLARNRKSAEVVVKFASGFVYAVKRTVVTNNQQQTVVRSW